MNNRGKALILLSGGLDSLVSLGVAREEYDITLALTFDYGQRTAQQEIQAAGRIAGYYAISHRIIKLPWLEEITRTSLVNKDENLPKLASDELDNPEKTGLSAKNVWVPNRNGLFVNIAAGFADSMEFRYIIFGANREEAVTFPDNSKTFIERINDSLEYSTLAKPRVIAPLADYDKGEIVEAAVQKNIPLSLVRSCYTDREIHCGECESCLRLKRALDKVFKNGFPVLFCENP